MLIEYSENQAQSTSSIKDCIKLLNKLELKILFILDENTKLVGTLTDGDIRRAILNGNELSDSILKALPGAQLYEDIKASIRLFISC